MLPIVVVGMLPMAVRDALAEVNPPRVLLEEIVRDEMVVLLQASANSR